MTADVADRLQLVRQLRGWSQRELAKRAGVTNSTISMIEQGRVSPSVSSLNKVLQGVPMSLQDFFLLPMARSDYHFYALPLQSWPLPMADDALGDPIDADSTASDPETLPELGSLTLSRLRLSPNGDTGVSFLCCPCERAGVVISGQIEVVTRRETRLLSSGEGYRFAAREPHRLRSPGDTECVLITASVAE